jgi:predicted component of type VI protein secretion system
MKNKTKNRKTYLYIVLMGIAMSLGCSTSKPKFEPLPPEKLHDLLHTTKNYAYKSITKEDYEIKEDC